MLASMLPPLLLVCGLAVAYIIVGVQTGTNQVTDFNPVDSVSVLPASAAGGLAGRFPASQVVNAEARCVRTMGMRVRYEREGTQFVAVSGGESLEEVHLVSVKSKKLHVPSSPTAQAERHNIAQESATQDSSQPP